LSCGAGHIGVFAEPVSTDIVRRVKFLAKEKDVVCIRRYVDDKDIAWFIKKQTEIKYKDLRLEDIQSIIERAKKELDSLEKLTDLTISTLNTLSTRNKPEQPKITRKIRVTKKIELKELEK